MSRPDSDTTRNEAHRTFTSRLTELANLGIHDLIFEQGKPTEIEMDELKVVSEFRGEPNVIIVATRRKQNEEILYTEEITLWFDGDDLVIDGTRRVFSGKIPSDETTRIQVIGRVIKEAFNNPRRKTLIDPNIVNH